MASPEYGPREISIATNPIFDQTFLFFEQKGQSLVNKNHCFIKQVHVFGALCYVYNEPTQKLAHSNKQGIFLGYGPSTSTILYYDEHSSSVKRAFHARIDDACVPVNSRPLIPLQIVFQHEPSKINHNLPEVSQAIEHITSPFQKDSLYTYSVTLPATGKIGLLLQNDDVFGIPVIVSMDPSSAFQKKCLTKLKKNSWIIGSTGRTADLFCCLLACMQVAAKETPPPKISRRCDILQWPTLYRSSRFQCVVCMLGTSCGYGHSIAR